MKNLLTTLLLTKLVMLAGIAKASDYYFSTALGDDSRTAAQAQNPVTPWKTLNKLNSFFSSLQPGDNVLFNRGDVFYGSIIINKSGTSGSPIIIGAYGSGAKPVITGFSTVSSWTAIGGGMYTSTAAVTTATTLNMVTFQDIMQPMGRWPKLGSNSNGGYLTIDSHSGNTSITSSDISGALSYVGGELVQRKVQWVIDRGTITAQTPTSVTYNALIPDNHPGSYEGYDAVNSRGFFFQNHINACTVLGEWAYDATNKKINMYFGGNSPASYTIKVTNVESLVSMTTKSYITFDNIEFKGSNSKTFNIATSDHIQINNCDIKYSGVEGIYVSSAASNNIEVYNSTISNTNNNAINGNGSPNWIIRNNILNKTGTVRGAGLSDDGQYVGMSSIGSNSIIEYNVITSTGYIGIHFLGSSVIVKNNFIDSFCTVKSDGGGIYAFAGGVVSTRIIKDNIIINGIGDRYGLEEFFRTDLYGGGDVTGIYLDGAASNIDITGNTVAWMDYNGIQLSGGKNILCENNTVFDCRGLQMDYKNGTWGQLSNLTVKHNILFAKEKQSLIADVYSATGNNIKNWGTIDSNYYCRPISEPTNISIFGWVGNNLGGIVQTNFGSGNLMNSLDTWQSVSSQDAHTLKSPKTITDVNDLRFEYNATTSNKVIPLPFNYIDVRGVTYSGTITIAPYSSAVLIKNGASTNQAPKANAGPDQTIILPSNTINLSGSGTDPDGTISSYLWTKISGPTAYTIANINSAATSVIGLVQGVYKFELKVTDNNGAVGKDTMQVTVNAAANITPVANAGSGSTITLPVNTTSLAGSGSDADGTIAGYVWSRVSGPATFTLGSTNAATTTLSNLVQGTYVFRLTVTDNSGATATDDVTVTVNAAPNQAPTANSGNNITLTLPTNSTTLTGNGSDPDGTIAGYVWSRVSGPATFTFGSANTAATTLSNLVQGTYTFRLSVTDNSGATATDDLSVTVNAAPNQAPTANAGNNITLTLPTNSTTLTGNGTDADGTIASYAWSRVSGPATFTLGSTNAATTTLSNLVPGTYTFRLTVTDNSGATATDDLSVTVNAAPNQAPTANAGNNITLTLPTNSTTLTGNGTDADGTIASYAWSRVSGPATFTFGSANAATTALSNLVQGTYTFRLSVTDNSGAADTDDMTVTVNAAPSQAPTANAGNNITLTLPTNSTTLTGNGTDTDGTIVGYVWSRVSGPATFTLGSANAATTALSNLVQGTYTFRLTVTDNSGATATDNLTVTVNAAPNQAPTANAGNNIVLTLPTNAATLTGSGTDTDGTIAGYVWSRVSGPAIFIFGSANAATTTLSNLVQGTYTFRLTVTDNSGATATDDLTVTVNAAPDQAPTANAGNNIRLTLPTNSTTLTGNGTDADGTIASYAWSRVSGPATFTLGSANAATTALSNLVQGTYTFRLTVTDNSGATATDDMTVTVNAAPNQAPTANAGNNIVLTLPTNAATLTGSGTDADGTIASYAWSRVSGPATFTLGSANAATTTLSNLVQGTYTFRLTVTDNSGAADTDDMTITVNAAPVTNLPPVANAGNNIVLTLPTNAATLTGSGTDADGTIASYAWSRVSGPATFTFGSANAATTALSNLVQGTYTFRLSVTDNSGATATDDLTVTVNAAPSQAPTANAGNNITLTLPTNSTTLTGNGTDADGTIASYAWSRVSGPATFTLGSANAATTALSNLVQGTYTFRLTVTDNSGATATDDLTVTVNAAPNQAPTANAGNNITLTLPTNSTTLTGNGTDADGTIASYAWSRVSGPATFTLGSANAATTALSNLVQGTYTFRLTVTDNSGATATDDMTVTVNAAPNQAPTANAGNNIVLTLPTNATTLTGTGTDPDGTIASYAWSRVSGPATFTLGSANAATTTLSNLVQGTYTFRLTVTDNSGATATDDLTVTVNAAPNQAPTANAGNNIVLTLPTNATTLTGTGTDTDGTIAGYVWSRVSGPATFTLGSANAATTALSNLVQGTYTFRLTVTDNSGATATDDLTVTVNAAPNQAPTANAGNNIVLTLPTNATTLTGTGTDPDGTIASYAWSRVSGPATFTLGSANAATTTLSNLVQGTYTFRLTVTDNSGATATDDLTVTVNAAPNQAPTANAGNNIVLTLPTNATTLTGTGTDTDGTIAGYVWSRVSGPATFTLGSANAATTALSNLVQGTYTFRLTVTDNSGATATDDLTVTVNAAPNQAPTANAGNNIVLTLPTNATTLTGTGTDTDGTIAGYVWSRVSGPATFTLGSANAATTALSNLVQGTYTFRLTVTDNSGATATDDLTVTVNAAPNQAPTANAGNNITLTLPTNSTTLTGNGTDADGTIASYAWSRVSGPATFTFGSANAATTALSNLVQGTYTFRLSVTDNSGAADTDDMTITVNAAPVTNQAPIANAGVSQVATLSSNEATLNGSLSRDPDGTIKSYKWEQISGPASATIATISLVTTKVSSFREGDYIFQLTVTDNLNAIAKDTVTIAVVNNFRSFPGDFMLYPNPATDKITLSLYNEKYSKAKITVYDIAGTKVLSTIKVNNSQTRFTKTIDISQLKAGVYLIEAIMDNKEKVTSKFIKL